MSDDKEFWRGINKAKYKSSGPLKSNCVNIYVYADKEKTIKLFNIGIVHHYNVHKPYLEDSEIGVYAPEPQNFMKFQNIINKNPDIKPDKVYEWIEKIMNYENWLKNVYKPKYSYMEQFFYQVYLWVKGDIDLFSLYSGAYAEVIYTEQCDDEYNDVSIEKKIIIKHGLD